MKKFILIPLLLLFLSSLSGCHRDDKIDVSKDSTDFLYGSWKSDVKLPMSQDLKDQFSRAGMGNDRYFKYGKEQVELIFRKIKNGEGGVDGGFVLDNTKYLPSESTDKEGFRNVQFNTNNIINKDAFRYKFINKNKFEMKMIPSSSDTDQAKKFDVFFTRENRK